MAIGAHQAPSSWRLRSPLTTKEAPRQGWRAGIARPAVRSSGGAPGTVMDGGSLSNGLCAAISVDAEGCPVRPGEQVAVVIEASNELDAERKAPGAAAERQAYAGHAEPC